MKIRILVILSFITVFPTTGHAQWVQTNGPYGGDITCLAVNGTNLFAGTPYGAFRSTNNGTSWASINNGLANTDVTTLFVNGSNIFAGTNSGGVFLSTDSGASWSSASFGLEPEVLTLTASGTDLFAGTSGGVYRSTNNGTTWTSASAGLQDATNVYAIAAIDSNLIAGTGNGNYLSTDRGISWTQSVWGPIALSFAMRGTELFAGSAGGGVLFSTDKGISWSGIVSGLLPTGTPIRSVAVNGTNLFAGTAGQGAYLSTNGGSFTHVGMTNNFVNALVVSGTNVFAGTNGYGVLMTKDSGKSWEPVNNGFVTTEIVTLVGNDANLFAGVSGDGVFSSPDNGGSWKPIPTPGGAPAGFIYAFAAIGTKLFVSSANIGTLCSTDNGTSWIPASTDLRSLDVIAFAVDSANFYAANYDGNVYRSTDSGASWNKTSGRLPILGSGITGGYALAASGTNLFAATDGVPQPDQNGIWLSTDEGSTWTLVNSSLSDNPDEYFTALAASGPYLFAGSNLGVFLSTDSGVSWTAVDSGLTNSLVLSLCVNKESIYAGTNEDGIWRCPLSEIIGTNAVGYMPSVVQSISAYPNPCTSSSIITFSCAESGVGEVGIFNLLGVEIARLYSGELDAGEHSFTWDASSEAAGMYACVVRVNGNVQRVRLAHVR